MYKTANITFTVLLAENCNVNDVIENIMDIDIDHKDILDLDMGKVEITEMPVIFH